jgi:hypothetical protein
MPSTKVPPLHSTSEQFRRGGTLQSGARPTLQGSVREELYASRHVIWPLIRVLGWHRPRW